MTQEKFLIAWEKWQDPYSPQENDSFEEMASSQSLEDDEEDDSDAEENNMPKNKSKGIPVIMTPMGVVPILQHQTPGKIFNLWIGHTNFNLTAPIVELINKTPGVETLDIYTPYRIRVGVGKLFRPRDVMHDISETLQTYLLGGQKYGSSQKKKHKPKV